MKGTSGMTLIEVLAALLVLTILVTAMGTCMALGLRAYEDMLFVGESGALSQILQTSLQDLLSFAENVQTDGAGNITFSSAQFGLQKGFLCVVDGKLCLMGASALPLVSPGVYGSMTVEDLSVDYLKQKSVFQISFRITNGRAALTARTAVRVING